MEIKKILYTWFYAAAFLLSMWGGLAIGFRGNSHTPPVPFVIEFFTLIIGLILLLIDAAIYRTFSFENFKVHIWGLTANGLVMAYIFIIY
jgi:hypothetical protein